MLAGAARQLATGGLLAIEGGGDFGEIETEDVVQQKGRPLER